MWDMIKAVAVAGNGPTLRAALLVLVVLGGIYLVLTR
jgi:hypothetical protein